MNDYPHKLSRGGYNLLEKKVMDSKIKASEEASQSDPSAIVSPPEPLERHERWKLARISASGEYMSDASRIVGEKIVSI